MDLEHKESKFSEVKLFQVKPDKLDEFETLFKADSKIVNPAVWYKLWVFNLLGIGGDVFIWSKKKMYNKGQ